MNIHEKLMLQQGLGFVFLIIGASLIGAEYGARVGLAVGLLVWSLKPVERG